MDQEDPTLTGIASELTTPGYLDRARVRSRASKTGWDVLFMPVGFALMGVYWYAIATGAEWLRGLVHAGQTVAPSPHPMTLSEALMDLAPILAVVPCGFLTSNFLMWLIPAARRAHEARSQQPGW